MHKKNILLVRYVLDVKGVLTEKEMGERLKEVKYCSKKCRINKFTKFKNDKLNKIAN